MSFEGENNVTEQDCEEKVVSQEDVGIRLDSFVSAQFDLTRSFAVKLIEDGCVFVDGKQKEKKYKVQEGQTISVFVPEPTPLDAQPEAIPIDVVYEDEDLLVINKEKGMVVHPAPGNETRTLVNALLYRCKGQLSGIGGVERPGIVHRIDKETSGLLVVAKKDEAHEKLSAQLKVHDVKRVYYAIVLGNIREESGTVHEPIGRHPLDRKRMAVVRNEAYTSRDAITHFDVLAHGEGDGMPFSFVRCHLETGRTHQIRVHMSFIGHPILGDTLYGGDKTPFEKHHPSLINGQCLHAGQLSFIHPTKNTDVHFEAPLPDYFRKLIQLIFPNYIQPDGGNT